MKSALISALVSLVVSTMMFFALTRWGAGAAALNVLGSPVDVPNLAGLTPDQARQLLDGRGLSLELTERVDDPRYRSGRICEQQPLEGSRLPRGGVIQAKVVRAVERVRVPAMVGRGEAEVGAMLDAVRLKLGSRSERTDEKVAPGVVLATTPAVGSEVVPGSAVDVVVAASPPVAVPRVTGRGLSGAKQALVQAGLTVGEVRYGRDEDSEEGVVLRQTPAAATTVPKGAKVDLVVNYTD